MLRDDAIALIAQRCNNRKDLNARILAEMQLVQEIDLEQNGKLYPWFLLTDWVSFPVTDTLAVPADFLAEDEESGFWTLVSGENTQVPKGGDKTLRGENYNTGSPFNGYTVAGEYFTFYPAQTSPVTVYTRYYAKDVILSSNIQNKWLTYATDLVIAITGARIAKNHLKDPALAQTFTEEIGGAWNRLMVLNEQRQHTNRNYRMG